MDEVSTSPYLPGREKRTPFWEKNNIIYNSLVFYARYLVWNKNHELYKLGENVCLKILRRDKQ